MSDIGPHIEWDEDQHLNNNRLYRLRDPILSPRPFADGSIPDPTPGSFRMQPPVQVSGAVPYDSKVRPPQKPAKREQPEAGKINLDFPIFWDGFYVLHVGPPRSPSVQRRPVDYLGTHLHQRFEATTCLISTVPQNTLAPVFRVFWQRAPLFMSARNSAQTSRIRSATMAQAQPGLRPLEKLGLVFHVLWGRSTIQQAT